MRQPERRGDGDRRAEPGDEPSRASSRAPSRSRAASARARRAPPSTWAMRGCVAKPARERAGGRRAAPTPPQSTKTGQSGIAPVAEATTTSDGERERPRGGERRVDAAGRPEPPGAVDRLRAERDLHRVAELGGGERVDHASRRRCRAAACRGQIRPPAAASAARQAPTVHAKPDDEAERGERRASAVGAGERVERRGDAAAEEAGRRARRRRAATSAAARERRAGGVRCFIDGCPCS